MKLIRPFSLTIILLGLISQLTFARESTAPVSGFARSFILGTLLSNATIRVNETGETFTTDSEGKFGPFQYPVGKPITLTFNKWAYKETQSATVIVPSEGLNTPYTNITFQVPAIQTFYILAGVIGASIDENSCHLTTTITAYHKTMDDDPQGIAGARVVISPQVDVTPFYFDIFRSGPLAGKTDPFTKGLTETSEDGGVALINIPPRDEPYTLTAEKQGVTFSKVQFMCKKGVYINLSPPQGPSEIR